MVALADQLAEGKCSVCQNNAFFQITMVVLEPTTTTITDASGRQKKNSTDVRKLLECASCKVRYIYHANSEAWRSL